MNLFERLTRRVFGEPAPSRDAIIEAARSYPAMMTTPCDDNDRHAGHNWQHPIGALVRCPGRSVRIAECQRWTIGQPHDAHDWGADSPARCPGYVDHDECPLCPAPAEPAPEPDPARTVVTQTRGPIGAECNNGGHYDCQGCGCGCHPPEVIAHLATLRRTT